MLELDFWNLTHLVLDNWNVRTDSEQEKKQPKREDLNVLVLSPSLSPHHSVCYFLCVWMSVARGTRYLEEVRLRQQEGQKARTEARTTQLKLTEFENRISVLERFKEEIQGKAPPRYLSFLWLWLILGSGAWLGLGLGLGFRVNLRFVDLGDQWVVAGTTTLSATGSP